MIHNFSGHHFNKGNILTVSGILITFDALLQGLKKFRQVKCQNADALSPHPFDF